MSFNLKSILAFFGIVLIFAMEIHAQSESANVPNDWRTLAEQTDYHKSWNYADTIAFAEKLAKSSPLIEYKSFGKSGEGRDLPLLIVSNNKDFYAGKSEEIGQGDNFYSSRNSFGRD